MLCGLYEDGLQKPMPQCPGAVRTGDPAAAGKAEATRREKGTVRQSAVLHGKIGRGILQELFKTKEDLDMDELTMEQWEMGIYEAAIETWGRQALEEKIRKARERNA